MADANSKLSVLLAGESWVSLGMHVKGFNNFPTAYYEEGLAPLAHALEGFARLTHLPSHLAATQFPSTLSELRQFDVVLFSDIGSDTLLLHPDTFLRSQYRPNRLALVHEFVQQGGGFAMLGGYMSFGGFEGKAHYHGTAIEEILPVEIFPYDDRVETPEGIRPVATGEAHPILHGIQDPWPRLLGYNRLGAKPEGLVLLTYGNDPMLVVQEYGRGRTAAFASDVSPHWGSQEFVDWKHYAAFWQQLVAWLAASAK